MRDSRRFSRIRPAGLNGAVEPYPASPIWLGTWTAPGTAPVAIVLAVLVGVTFWNSMECSLTVLDNEPIILLDPRIREATWDALAMVCATDYWFPTLHSNLYRPVTTLSYLVNYAVLGHGTNPVGYHVVNMLLHWANAVMAFLLMAGLTRERWLSALVAGVFAVHPLTTEAVTNVVGRADLLVTAGVLAGLLCARSGGSAKGTARVALLAGLALCSALAVFSKESGIAVGVAVALLDLTLAREMATGTGEWRRVWRERFVHGGWARYCVIAAVALAFLQIRAEVLKDSPVVGQVAVDNPIAAAGPLVGRMTAVHVLGKYLALVVWPESLSCDYSYNQIPLFSGTAFRDGDWQTWLALGTISALVGLGFAAFRHDPALFFCLAFAAAMIAPVSNVFFCTGTIMAERVMYPSLIGLLGAVACGLSAGYGWLARRAPGEASRLLPMTALLLAAAVVVAGACRSRHRNEDWRDEESLWISALAACPNSHKVHKGLAEAVARRLVEVEAVQPQRDFHVDLFRTAVLERAARGLRIYDDAPLGLVHDPVRLLGDLMRYHLSLGDRMALEAGVDGGAGHPPARDWYERGEMLGRRAMDAERAINDASKKARRKRGVPPSKLFDLGDPGISRTRAELLMRLDRWADAVPVLEHARHLEPGEPAHYFLLARCHEQAQRKERAIVTLLETLWIAPEPDREAALAEVAGLLGDHGESSPPMMRDAEGRWRLSMQSPLLLGHLQQACCEMIGVFVESKHYDEARRMYERGVRLYKVSPEMVAQYLPELDAAR